jgi:hypothetical protein
MANSTLLSPLGCAEDDSSCRGPTLGSGGPGDPDFVSRHILTQIAAENDASPGRMQTILAALAGGRLTADMNNVKGQLRAIGESGSWTDRDQHLFHASPELIGCLAGLLDRQATMTIMSLFRFEEKKPRKPHGEIQADGSAIGRAVDIMVYMGFKIHLKTPDNANEAISGIVEVIGHLPAGKYDLGLPRPGGGVLVDPEHDVFLRVTSRDQAQKSPSGGHFNKDLDLLLEPARTRLREAFKGNPHARIRCMYPDGVDHLHITTLA